MAVKDYTQAGGMAWDGKDVRFQLYAEITVLLADIVAANQIRCLKIPEGCIVHDVYIQMVTPAVGTALAANVGVANASVTGYDEDGYDAAMSLKGAAGTLTRGVSGTDALALPGAGFFAYTGSEAAGASIDITFSTVTAVTGAPKFKIWADCEYLRHVA